jgi:hypothetical protein
MTFVFKVIRGMGTFSLAGKLLERLQQWRTAKRLGDNIVQCNDARYGQTERDMMRYALTDAKLEVASENNAVFRRIMMCKFYECYLQLSQGRSEASPRKHEAKVKVRHDVRR